MRKVTVSVALAAVLGVGLAMYAGPASAACPGCGPKVKANCLTPAKTVFQACKAAAADKTAKKACKDAFKVAKTECKQAKLDCKNAASCSPSGAFLD
jgi:hypothetical protein